MAPKVCRKTSEDHFLEVTPQKRSAKVARQLFGQVWEILCKNPLHPKNLLAPTPMPGTAAAGIAKTATGKAHNECKTLG